MAAKSYVAVGNLFLAGSDTKGKVNEFKLDNMPFTTDKHEALGMLGTQEVFTGLDQLTGSFVFVDPDDALYNQLATPWETVGLTFLAVMMDKSYTPGTNRQLKIDLIGRPKEIGLGEYANQKIANWERPFFIDKLKISFGGVDQIEYDYANNIYKVNGVDKWADFRALLGQ